MDLLDKLNFDVAVEDFDHSSDGAIPKGNFSSEEEFRSLCGLWKERDISAKEIRELAWLKVDL